jgi:DNA uptake protein ComE-like DNA-binding protein
MSNTHGANINHLATQKDRVAQATTRLFVLSWFVVAVCLARVGLRETERLPTTLTGNLVDPNHAPWWEMTVLPEIGPAIARQIVDFREAQRIGERATSDEVIFKSASDLDRVRGIGPKTIARLAPHLRFGSDGLNRDQSSHHAQD